MYLLSAVCLMMLLSNYNFMATDNSIATIQPNISYVHTDMTRPSAAVALELSTLSESIHVHITHLRIPITLLSVHENDHNEYYIVSGNWIYDFLKISQSIILLHTNGIIPICTPLTFKISLFQ